MVSKWKAEFLERAPMVFEKGTGNAEKLIREHEEEKAEFEKKVGQLAIEVDWLEKNLDSSKSYSERVGMMERDHKHAVMSATTIIVIVYGREWMNNC